MKNDNTQSTNNESGVVLYRYLTWDAFVKTLDSWMMKATIPAQTNDLFEFLPAMTGDIGIYDLARRQLRGGCAFFSFSKKCPTVPCGGTTQINSEVFAWHFTYRIKV